MKDVSSMCRQTTKHLKKMINHFHIVVEPIKKNARDFQNLPHGDPNSEMNK